MTARPATCRVLLVEDDPGDAHLLRLMLQERSEIRYDIVWVTTLADAQDKLTTHDVDVVLMDLSLPDSTGIDSVWTGRAAAGKLPLIVLTGFDDPRFALQTLDAGAQDYLVKGSFDGESLSRVIRHAISRNRLEQDVLASKRFAQATLDSLSTQICALSDSGRIISVNDAWRRFGAQSRRRRDVIDVGVNYAEVSGTLHAVSSDYAHAMRFSQRLREVIAGERAQFELEYPVDTGDKVLWFLARVSRFSDAGPARFVVAHEDITERRLAEQAIRDGERRLQRVLAATNDGWWDMDLSTGRVHYSPRWWTMLGYVQDEFPPDANLWQELIHPDDVAGVNQSVEAAIAGNIATYEVEMRMLHKAGHYVPVLTRGHIERDPGGIAVRVSGSNTDLTERKQADAGSRLALVGTLAAGAAHEINNPLTFIMANLEFVLEQLRQLQVDPKPLAPLLLDEMIEASGEAYIGAERVQTIVAGLRAFSRPAADSWIPVNVSAAVQAAVHFARNDLRHRARVVTRLADVPEVMASPHALEQVFLNLLVNASLAIPEGRADKNEISIAVMPNDGGDIIVEVRDTGSGMSPEVQSRLFEPFFTTRAVGSGTGLGLPICHGIVTSIGGKIEIDSELGVGSVFRVILPARAAMPAKAEVRANSPVALPKDRRVLVIDDDPNVIRVISRALAGGPDLAIELDARAALARVDAGEHVDLIICDLMMPNMTGMEFQDALRERQPALADGMMFITGGAFTPAAQEFVANSANTFIDKPFKSGVLRAAVAERLAG